MGSAVSKNNKDYINNNWDDIKCSPMAPFLQMIGIAPGNSNETVNTCKASEFSSQFNSSMTEHINMTGKLTSGLNSVSTTMDKFRMVIASMEQRAFDDLSQIATQIFAIYVKIGNLFYILIKNLMNIMNIFKSTVGVAASISNLLIAFIDLLRVPVNSTIDFVQFFTRGI